MGAVCAHARPETVAGGRHLVNASEAVHLKPTMVGIFWSLPSTTDSDTRVDKITASKGHRDSRARIPARHSSQVSAPIQRWARRSSSSQ